MVNVLLNWLKHPGTFHLCTSVIQVLRDSRQNAVNWVPLKKKRTFHFHFALTSFWRLLSSIQVLLILEFFSESQLARLQTINQNRSFFAKFSKQELSEYSPTPARLLPFQMQIIGNLLEALVLSPRKSDEDRKLFVCRTPSLQRYGEFSNNFSSNLIKSNPAFSVKNSLNIWALTKVRPRSLSFIMKRTHFYHIEKLRSFTVTDVSWIEAMHWCAGPNPNVISS